MKINTLVNENEILESFEENPFNNLYGHFKPYQGKVNIFNIEPIYITTPICDGKSSLDETIAIYWTHRGYLFRYSKYWGNVPQENNTFIFNNLLFMENSDITIPHYKSETPKLMFIRIKDIRYIKKYQVANFSDSELDEISRKKTLFAGGNDIISVSKSYSEIGVSRTDLVCSPIILKSGITYKSGVKRNSDYPTFYLVRDEKYFHFEFKEFRLFNQFNFKDILDKTDLEPEKLIVPDFLNQIKVRLMNRPYLQKNNSILFFKDINNTDFYKYILADIKYNFKGYPLDKKIFVIENPTDANFKAFQLFFEDEKLSKKEYNDSLNFFIESTIYDIPLFNFISDKFQ